MPSWFQSPGLSHSWVSVMSVMGPEACTSLYACFSYILLSLFFSYYQFTHTLQLVLWHRWYAHCRSSRLQYNLFLPDSDWLYLRSSRSTLRCSLHESQSDLWTISQREPVRIQRDAQVWRMQDVSIFDSLLFFLTTVPSWHTKIKPCIEQKVNSGHVLITETGHSATMMLEVRKTTYRITLDRRDILLTCRSICILYVQSPVQSVSFVKGVRPERFYIARSGRGWEMWPNGVHNYI